MMSFTSNPAVPAYNIHMVPLEEVIQRPDFAIETSPQAAVDEIRTLNNMPSASLSSSPINNSIGSPTVPALLVTPKSIQDRPIIMAPARHASSRANVMKRTSRRRGSDVSPKPMRPLASFFNEFIQNIRNVTVSQDQPSVSDKHLVSKRPLRKASRNGEPFDKHPFDRMTSLAPPTVMFRIRSTSV
ncbi:hypothetical protein BYT27DRAFT_6615565 [Phlegmacium glaucopus]|nr:hypothetical protein BYT27DRAFT_6615565 [Phlegmacium glaucopus]